MTIHDPKDFAAAVAIRDIAGTRTLPAYYYTDPSVLEIEKNELFFKSWHYACHVDLLDAPGKYVTLSLFDQDIVLVMGRDNRLRAFYNVCAHRGHRLLEGHGKAHRITCPYHAWSYRLDGSLQGIRGGDGEQSFAASDICLSGVRVDRLLDFIFINLDPKAPSLANYAPGLAESILSVVPNISTYKPRGASDYFGGGYDCNWKVVIDNFLECYHCEVAHPSFKDIADIPRQRFSYHGTYSYQHVPSTCKAENAAFPLDLEEDDLDGHFWFLFPNTILSVFPGVKNFSLSRSDPEGPERTVRYFDTFSPPGISKEREAARAKWGLEVVNEEDKSLCEKVQRGMHQRGFTQGYYLIDPANQNLTEEAVRFFHRLYAARLEQTIAAKTRGRV